MPAEEVFDAVAYQLGIFQAIASALGCATESRQNRTAPVQHAVRDVNLADAIARPSNRSIRN